VNPINRAIVTFVKILPKSVVHIFAKKYIAGEQLDDAIKAVKELNANGIYATMDVLGEAISNKDEALEAKKDILAVIDAIKTHNLKSGVSVKPTQMGLMLDYEFAYEQFKEIIRKAHENNIFVRIDMEDSSTTDKTLELYQQLNQEFNRIGIVLQAYMRRTVDDIKKLNPQGADYRLCKGIYVEPASVAYKGFQEVRDNFIKGLELILDNGNYVGIATHDDYLIDKSYEMIESRGLEKDKYEFQMLYGVKEKLRDKINKDGHKVRVYVPFGTHWYAYSVRRLQENPQLAWYITKSIFKRD
jgi:proline dehydrogenase